MFSHGYDLDNGDGTCNIAYWPTECGDYSVNITFNDEHIPDSPYPVTIYPTPNLERITVSGSGIEIHGKFRKSWSVILLMVQHVVLPLTIKKKFSLLFLENF